MDFLEEIKQMLGDEIKQLVPKILRKIRQKSTKFDRILDDKDKNFENYFLSTAKNRFESEYKDYVQKEIFLREVELPEINNVNINENPVKLEIIDEDDSNSTSTLVNEYPAKAKVNDEPSYMDQSKVDYTPMHSMEPNSTGRRMKDSPTDCNTTPSNQQLNRLKSNVECSSGMRCTDILDKSCPPRQKSPSITKQQLNRSKSHEVKDSNSMHETSSHNSKVVILFYCSHCSFDAPNPEAYNNLKALLNHWTTKHVKKQDSLSFYVGTHHRCTICSTPNLIFKSFKKAIHHFQDKHPNEQFFVTDQKDDKKCSICEFKSDDNNRLAEHFRLNHPFVKNAFVFDPIRLNQNQLNELITNKMYKCETCNEAVVSKQEANINHKCKIISNEGTKFEKMFEEKPTAIRCGKCNEETHDEEAFNCHFESHRFADDGKLGYSYYKTKYLYGNGLIVCKYNLLEKNDEENEKIKSIIEDRELRLQQKELNKLLLFGELNQFQTESLRESFIRMCVEMFGLRVDVTAIKYIRHTAQAITVELFSAELKNKILDKVEPTNFIPELKIKIVPKLTKYYQTLSKKARKMIKNNQICRERILERGLAIQVHQNCNTVQFVNSIEELDKLEVQYANGKRGLRYEPQMLHKRPRNHF